MLFEQRLWAGLADGTVTVTFRRWPRPRARAGGRHRTPAGVLAVDAVTVVDPAAITEDDARRAGVGSLAELRRRLDRLDRAARGAAGPRRPGPPVGLVGLVVALVSRERYDRVPGRGATRR
jgi:hypothetical protein